MKRILLGAFLCVAFMMALTVWPTPWRYETARVHRMAGIAPVAVRTNRLSGESQYLSGYGWLPMNTARPASAPVTTAPRAEVAAPAPAPRDPSDPFDSIGR